MAEKSITIEDLKKALGTEKISVVEIEKGMIKRYAEAVEDLNPLWYDDDYARNGPHGTIVAPPAFLATLFMSGHIRRPDLPDPLPRLLDGGGEWEFFQPLRPGDVITINGRFTDIVEKVGRLGKMLLWTFEMTYSNQKGELVARCSTTRITY